MEKQERLWSEFGSLLRGLKTLNAHAIEASGVRVELATVTLLGRLALLGPVRLTELAASLGLDPSSVSRQVTGAERSGLITRDEDPTDRRATHLVLTDKGRRVVQQVHEKRAIAFARLIPEWTDAEVDDLADLLARLNHDVAANRHVLEEPELENA